MAKRSDLVERCRAIPIEPILRELGAASVPHGNGWLRMLCPIHGEETSSASVNHGLRRFRCHGCGAAGDAVRLLMEVRDIEFRAAVEAAEAIAGTGSGVVPRKPRRPDLGVLR